MSRNYFKSESGVLLAIDEFGRGAIPCDRWNHGFRLVVTMWYLMTYEEAEATARLVSGMRAMARTHDLPTERLYSYNETATVFWMAIARLFLSSFDPDADRLNVLNRFLESYSDRESLILEHYRPRTLQSLEARVRWMEPDLEPLAVPWPSCDTNGKTRDYSDGVHVCRPGQC